MTQKYQCLESPLISPITTMEALPLDLIVPMPLWVLLIPRLLQQWDSEPPSVQPG